MSSGSSRNTGMPRGSPRQQRASSAVPLTPTRPPFPKGTNTGAAIGESDSAGVGTTTRPATGAQQHKRRAISPPRRPVEATRPSASSGQLLDNAGETMPLPFPPIRLRSSENVNTLLQIDSLTAEDLTTLGIPVEDKQSPVGPSGAAAAAADTHHPAGASPTSTTQSPSISLVEFSTALANLGKEERELFVVNSEKRAKKLRQTALEREWTANQGKKEEMRRVRDETAALESRILKGVQNTLVKLEGQAVHTLAYHVAKQGLASTSRGLALPYPWYAGVVQSVDRTIREQCTLPVVSLEKQEQKAPPDSSPGTFASVAPLVVGTATTVAVLWRMLEQVSGPVAGMSTALQLFKQLLNLVYINFDNEWKYAEEIPENSLAEQVRQLLKLDLHAVAAMQAETASQQLASDVKYYARAMENWAFQIWRQQKVESRRRETFVMRLEDILRKIYATRAKRDAFALWKQFIRHRRTTKEVLHFNENVVVLDPQGKEYIPKGQRKHSLGGEQQRKSSIDFGDGEDAHSAAKEEKEEEDDEEGTEYEDDSDDEHQEAPHDGTAISQGGRPSSATKDARARSKKLFLRRKKNKKQKKVMKIQDKYEGELGPLLEHYQIAEVLRPISEKMKQLEDVNGVLRAQVALHRKRLAKSQADATDAKTRLRAAEEKELNLLAQLLTMKNELQTTEMEIQRLMTENAVLNSKVKMQEHRRWRSAGLHLIESMCGMTYEGISLGTTDQLWQRKKVEETSVSSPICMLKEGEKPTSMAPLPTTATAGEAPTAASVGSRATIPRPVQYRSQYAALPNPIDVLRDWANRCLDELTQLEKGGTWSTAGGVRVSEFSAELRDGTIYSRLLFYLSLPRYEKATPDIELEAYRDASRNRQRMLIGEQTQCAPPFPTYNDCFNDLLRLPHILRHSVLIDYAAQMLSGVEKGGPKGRRTTVGGSGHQQQQHSQPPQAHSPPHAQGRSVSNPSMPSLTSPSYATGYPLQAVVTSSDLADGNRNANITLLAILYCTFAHPFNHKSIDELAAEKEIIHNICGKLQQVAAVKSDLLAEEQDDFAEMLLEHIDPPVCSTSHLELLQGRFWTEESLPSSESMKALATIVNWLSQSMQEHKWHVALGTLIPLSQSTMLQREGNRPALLLTDREWEVASVAHGTSELLTIKETHAQRFSRVALDPTRIKPLLMARGEELVRPNAMQEMLDHFERYAVDLVSLFIRYSTVSVVRGTRAIGVSEWRQLWQDAGVKLHMDVLMLCFMQCHGSYGGGGLPSEGAAGNAFLSMLDRTDFDDDSASVGGGTCAPTVSGTSAGGASGSTYWRSVTNFEMLFDDFVEGVVRVAHRYIRSPMGLGQQQQQEPPSPHSPSLQLPSAMITSDESLGSGESAGSGGGVLRSPTTPTRSASRSRSRAKSPSARARAAKTEQQTPPSASTIATASTPSHRQQATPCALPDAVLFIIAQRLLTIPKRRDFSSFVEAWTQCPEVRKVMQKYQPDVAMVFTAYCKGHRGITCMDLSDLLRLAKETGWLTHELTPHTIQDIVAKCVQGRDDLRLISEQLPLIATVPAAAQGEGPGGAVGRRSPRAMSPPKDRTVSPSLPSETTAALPASERLMLEPDLWNVLLVVTQHKYPSPFVASAKKLDLFLSRNLMEPLRARTTTTFSRVVRGTGLTVPVHHSGGTSSSRASGRAASQATTKME